MYLYETSGLSALGGAGLDRAVLHALERRCELRLQVGADEVVLAMERRDADPIVGGVEQAVTWLLVTGVHRFDGRLNSVAEGLLGRGDDAGCGVRRRQELGPVHPDR